MTIETLKARRVQSLPGSPVANTIYFVDAGSNTFNLYVTNNDGTIVASALVDAGDVPAGGSAGQMLVKSSATDYDTEWVSNAVTSRTALKAIDTSVQTNALLVEAGREGWFDFRSGDYSAEITADTQEGVYIKADDTAAASGAWVRSAYQPGTYHIAWFGGDPANATNTAAFDGMAALAIAEGGGELNFDRGEYTFATNPASITLDARQSLTMKGVTKIETALVMGASCTRGFAFSSTSTTDQQRPELNFSDFELRPGAADQGVAIECDWADGDYSYGGFHTTGLWIYGDGTVNFERGFKLTNAKHSLIEHFTAWGNYTTNASLDCIQLLGDCISPSIRDAFLLGWDCALKITGTTEGVYLNTVNVVSGRYGVDWDGGAGLEPVLSVKNSNIHVSRLCIKADNISEASITGNSFYCYTATDSGNNWKGIEVSGANARNWTITENHIRTDATARAADTLTGIDLQTGSGHICALNTIQGESGFVFAVGISVASGVTAMILDQPYSMTNVTTPVSAAGTAYQPFSIGSSGFMNVGIGTNGAAFGASAFPLANNTYDIGFVTTNTWRNIFQTGYLSQVPRTVANLPAAGTAGAGARLFVSDANATTFASIVAGGGANNVPVYSDGTNWRIG